MNYLIYFGSGIGDVAIIYPFIYALHKYDSDSRITLLQCSNMQRTNLLRSMLPVLNIIDGIEYYSVREPLHDLMLLMKLGRKKYDVGFALQYTVNEHTSKWPMRILNYASKRTIGFANPYRKGVVYNENIVFDKGIKRVENFYHMLDRVGIPHDINYTNMIQNDVLAQHYLPPEFKKECCDKVVALVIGCTDFRRSWFYDRWMELANDLLSEECQVIILGGSKEAREMQEQNISVPARANSYIGTCNLLSSLSILSQASIIVGADTGLIQFAGVLGKKNIVLLGCTDYCQVLPWGKDSYYITADIDCSPCFSTEREVTCQDAKCMKAITVYDVLHKIKEVM